MNEQVKKKAAPKFMPLSVRLIEQFQKDPNKDNINLPLVVELAILDKLDEVAAILRTFIQPAGSVTPK